MTNRRPIFLAAAAFALLTLACLVVLEIEYRHQSAALWVLIAPGWTVCSALFREAAPCLSAPAAPREVAVVLGASASWALLLVAAAWFVGLIRRCARGPNLRAARFTLAAIAGLYLVLWGATASFGSPQLHRTVLAAVRDSAGAAQPPVRPPVLIEHGQLGHDDPRVKIPWYYTDVRAAAPFLVRIDRGYQAGPLWGSGGRDWYLWLFGLRFRLVQTDWWVS